MLKVLSRINLPIHNTSGIDCLELCLNKKYFQNYPKLITYQYNSNGFRDTEWPKNFSDVIWCVGDSFTVGIGQPMEETWPKLLEKKTGKRCLNLGEDGCSNDSIFLRIKEIYEVYKPKLIVVMWSFLHRRRNSDGDNIQYIKKDTSTIQEDLENFEQNYKSANSLPIKIINLLIPNACCGYEKALEKKYKDLKLVKQLDYARDYLHFDIQTSHYICNYIVKKIKKI